MIDIFREISKTQTCSAKIRYETFAQADAAAEKTRLHGEKRGILNAYRCDRCGGFHVGNKYRMSEAGTGRRRPLLRFPK